MSDTSKQSMLNSNQTKTTPNNGLPVGVLVGIVIGCLILIAIFSVSAFFIYRRIKHRRRNHGEYRPQSEEAIYAKDLPSLTPPNPPQIDGLI